MRSLLVLTFAVFLSAPQARASRDEKRKHRTHQNLDLSEGLRSILEKISTGVDSNSVDTGVEGNQVTDEHIENQAEVDGKKTVNFEDCTLDAKSDTNAALERLAKCVQALNQYQTDQVSKAFKESGESNIKFEQQYQQALSLLNKIRDTAGLQNAKKEDTRRATDELISRLGEVKLLTEALKGKTITKTEKKPAATGEDEEGDVQERDGQTNSQGGKKKDGDTSFQEKKAILQGETGDSLLAEATSDEKQDQKSGDGVHALEIASDTPPKSSGEQGNEGFDATNEKHDQGYGGGVSALEVAAETSQRGIAEQGDQDSDVDGNNRDRQSSSAGSPELKMKDFNLPGLSMATMGQE